MLCISDYNAYVIAFGKIGLSAVGRPKLGPILLARGEIDTVIPPSERFDSDALLELLPTRSSGEA